MFSFLVLKRKVDCNKNALLNISKPRNDSVPYPDKKPPFHLPDRIPDGVQIGAEEANTLKCHCVYSLAVLLLFIIEQKYKRPTYADTSDVSRVYCAIAEGEDSRFIGLSNQKKSLAQRQALEIVASTFNAQRQKDVKLSWLNDFKDSIEKLFSSDIITHESAV